MKTTKSKAATTKKMSKDEAVKFLSATIVEVAKTDDGLAKRVDYALTHKTKATMSDLADLVDEVKATLDAATTTEPERDPEDEPAPETVSTEDDPEFDEPEQKKSKPVKPSKKPEQKSTKKPVVEKSEKPAVKQENKTTKTEGGKTTIKKSTKKQEKKSEEQSVQTAPTLGNSLPTAKIFPTTIKDGSGNEWQSAPFNFQNMDELFAYIQGEPDENGEYNNPRAIVFATYWTPAMIKKYHYAASFLVPEKVVPKKFTYDLDILELVFLCDNIKRLYAKSTVTDAVYFFDPSEIAPVKEKNPITEEEYFIRVSNGMEYEIYVDPAEFQEYVKKSVKS